MGEKRTEERRGVDGFREDCQEATHLAACTTSKQRYLSSLTKNSIVAHRVYLVHPENGPSWGTWFIEFINWR